MRSLNDKEFIIVEIKQHDIEKKEYGQIENLLNTVKTDHDRYHQTLHFIFDGYNQNPREIFEIEAIRQWTTGLVKKYPEILYFMENEQCGFQNVLLCIGKVEKQLNVGKEVLLNLNLEPILYQQIIRWT